MIAGFRREVQENCALLGYYAASSGNFLPTFRDPLHHIVTVNAKLVDTIVSDF